MHICSQRQLRKITNIGEINKYLNKHFKKENIFVKLVELKLTYLHC